MKRNVVKIIIHTQTFFLISNKNILKKYEGCHLSIYEVCIMEKTSQVHKVQNSMKPWTEKKERKPHTATQSKSLKKEEFKI